MITTEEALNLISENCLHLGKEKVLLEDALGRTLAEEVLADRPFPPYDRVTMDGIAIAYSQLGKEVRTFIIESTSAAGSPQTSLIDKCKCIEVMTGSVLPKGTDTVMRYEDVSIENGVATITETNVRKGQNVHAQGSDVAKGAILIHKGIPLSPAEISIAASVGKRKILCASLPRTIIVTTGDELIDIDKIPLPHQIRKSNGQTIAALLDKFGIAPSHHHLTDDKLLMKEELEALLTNNELIILSGGVSKGKFDFVPEVMEELGVKKIFHRVKQKPGKPLWFGRKGDCVLFGLPGNPVSSFVSTRKYIFWWLFKSLQQKEKPIRHAELKSDFEFKADLHLFLPVKLEYSEDGKVLALPCFGNGSGDFVNLKNTDAFMELPRGQSDYEKGETYPILTYRD